MMTDSTIIPIYYTNRQLIPVWRSFSESRRQSELSSAGKHQNQRPDLSPLLSDWVEKPSLVLAGEIISAAVAADRNDFPEYDEAKDYLKVNTVPTAALEAVMNRYTHLNSIVSSNSEKIVNQFDLLLEDITIETIEKVWERIRVNRVNELIHQAKSIAHQQLANPVAWVDAARLYTIKGQHNKAVRCMRIALGIDPNNRFVLRAATTLFVHNGDPTQALHYLRRSSRTKHDPWLTSAHIAASGASERFSPFLKEGRLMLADTQIAPTNLTELASSIATEEFISGNIKRSRNHFELSLKHPNGNTLAQSEWVAMRDHRFPFNPALYHHWVSHPFEADALDAARHGRWEEAVFSAIKWFLEIPYNRQSAMLCVFLLTTIFENYTEAIRYCEAALRIHNDDPALLNNLIYCYIMLDRQHEIAALLKRFTAINISELGKANQIAHIATLGLLAIREGHVETGKEYYEAAVSLASRYKDEERGNLAFIHLAQEMVRINHPDKEKSISRVIKINQDTKAHYIKFSSDRFIRKLGLEHKSDTPLVFTVPNFKSHA